MKHVSIITIFILALLLQGCYCFRTSYHENVRFAWGSSSPLCKAWGAGGRSLAANVYYGFPNTDEKKYTSLLTVPFTSSHHLTSNLTGFRIEKYVRGHVPYAVMGLGIDYSRSNVNLTYQSITNSNTYSNRMRAGHSRIMGSLNYMTLVQGVVIGYASLQAGWNFMSREESIDIQGMGTTKKTLASAFEYRAGYGLQFYLAPERIPGLAAVIEGGYGGGAYVRGGLCYWLD